MKLRSFVLGAMAAVAALVSCENLEQNLGKPEISISTNEMEFTAQTGSQELTVTATTEWWVESDVDWVDVDPGDGKASADPQTVTVTVLENTGMDRTVDLKFTIGMKSKYLTVNQAGPGGSPEALIVYSNDFDALEAEKTYGSSANSWPYLDQFPEGWKSPKGTGVENVDYLYGGMSLRNNANSDGSYSDYAGSGLNNLFFGSSAYFAVTNIALNGAKDFTLTFGTEKYSQDNGNTFTKSEFHIFLSNDATKWIEFTDYSYNGEDGRWNIATANFSVPEGTENLSICMQVDVASSYRLDDLKLVISEGGEAVDFTKGVEKDFTKPSSDNQGGGESDATAIYSNNYDQETATKTYGSSGNSWPYLDQFSGWKNAAGTGAAEVTYNYSGTSVRNNSNSNGGYSDYAGSGLNNIFFGASAYFATNNIALNGATTLTLTFGADKYLQDGNSTFSTSEYLVYVSNDGSKWVPLPYEFAGTEDGRWNVATAHFTVPEGTANISICMEVTVASAYRLDDFKLVEGTEAGTVIDFAQGVEKDFSAGGTPDSGEPETPPTPPAGDGSVVTIAEFLEKGGSAIEGVVISNMSLNNLTSKKSMYIQDETAGLQFYLAENHEFAFGDKVRIDLSGVSVGEYNGAVQISGLTLGKITKISSGNAVTPKTVSIDDFLANKYEGQYVAIEGVQVKASDLSKTWGDPAGSSHITINMEDADGNSFVVFSSKYASYKSETVAQGSGKICGISSISKGVMQLIFAQTSDFAGLTGERFDAEGGSGSGDSGEEPETPPTPPAGEAGEYDSTISWTLGSASYDNTSSGNSAQKADVNGVFVSNILKFGKGGSSSSPAVAGDATLHIPAGVSKIGFYAVGWKGTTVPVKFSIAGEEIAVVSAKPNVGATGNPKYTITVTEDDYYEVEIPTSDSVVDVKVETYDTAGKNHRAILFAIKPVTE